MRKAFAKNAHLLEREERRKKRNMLLMSVFLIFILVSSLFGYAFFYSDGGGGRQSIEDYGHTFQLATVDGQQKWESSLSESNPTFYELPSQVEGYYSEVDAETRFLESAGLILTFNPLQIDQNMVQFILPQFSEIAQEKPVTVGITQQLQGYENVPVVTCDNATVQFPVLELGITNVTTQTGILLNENCITVKATNPQDLFFMTEKLRYLHYGIDFSQPILE